MLVQELESFLNKKFNEVAVNRSITNANERSSFRLLMFADLSIF